ncbi:hypothetical protein LPJ61_001522 [Coemansia biformis]|uniref:Uncharacterized protein n=1 Tax=Coemansia biformis TaxID=1286918 RepID=A0A9W7YFT7_9FUNG|nr:hypothetical protein LPJ61_001522 [Coemansia biformis]
MAGTAMRLPSGAAATADIERRILGPRLGRQAPVLRAARRRFLELHALLAVGQSHGAPRIQRDLLIGQVRALELPSEPGCAALPAVEAGRLAPDPAAAADAAPGLGRMCAHIEDTQAAVAALPGLQQLAAGPHAHDVAGEQCLLLSAQAHLIGELAGEAELLAALGRHAAGHPIHEIAHGLERYFGGLIDSLSLKLQIVAAEMYRTLYAPEVLAAAARLTAILRAREAALAKEQSALDERLAIYRDAGCEFQEIALAYTAVLKDSDQIRRDIARVSRL